MHPFKKYNCQNLTPSLVEDPFNRTYSVVNHKIVPFHETLYMEYNNALCQCRILAILYMEQRNDSCIPYSYMVELANPTGNSTKRIFWGAINFFETSENYYQYIETSDEKYIMQFSRFTSNVFLSTLLNHVPLACRGRQKGLWKWDSQTNRPTFFVPHTYGIWADEQGIHFIDSFEYFSNTDKYFTNKESCVTANRIPIIKFGEAVSSKEEKEYTIEVSVKIKAKSYEEALELSKTYKI